MGYVDDQVNKLKDQGIYIASEVDQSAIDKVINMDEWDYYTLDIMTLESYLGLLAQHIYFMQQLSNIADAKEIELGNTFKFTALPHVVGAKIRSVEERWLYAATLDEELKQMFDDWQQSVADAILMKDLPKSATEKLNVLKKIYDDRRMEGNNKNNHKYIDGGS